MSDIEPVQRQFGRTAAAYVESATHAHGADLDRIVALAAEHGGDRVLDVGTGVGHTLRRVAPQYQAQFDMAAMVLRVSSGSNARSSCPSFRDTRKIELAAPYAVVPMPITYEASTPRAVKCSLKKPQA